MAAGRLAESRKAGRRTLILKSDADGWLNALPAGRSRAQKATADSAAENMDEVHRGLAGPSMISRHSPLLPEWPLASRQRRSSWILECRKGSAATPKSTGWRSRSFHRRRDSLLRRISKLCGKVKSDSLAALADLPEWHP